MAQRRNKSVGYLVIFLLLGLGVLFLMIVQDLDVQPGSGIGGYFKAISDKIGRSLSRGFG